MKPNGIGRLLCLLVWITPVAAEALYTDRSNPDSEAPVCVVVKLSDSVRPAIARIRSGASTTGESSLDAVTTRFGVKSVRTLVGIESLQNTYSPLSGVLIVEIPPGTDADAVVEAYRVLDVVDYAELDRLLGLFETPNDPLFSNQWGLHNIGQPHLHVVRLDGPGNDTLTTVVGLPDADIDAHELLLPSADDTRTVVVAIIDTGVDGSHPDLANRLWINPGEIPGNGMDDDHNGYVDDVTGWDFSGDALRIPPPQLGDNDPSDELGHGTHCAGIVAARSSNGKGIAGAASDCLIMPLKIFPTALNSVAARAIVYAADNGADVINMSWGGPWSSQLLCDALDYARARGVVLIAGAGNSGTEDHFYPAAYDHVMAVAATDDWDRITEFSSYGNYLDCAAPGQSILSLRAAGTDMYAESAEPLVHIIAEHYYLASGTSMAAPLAAAVAADVRAHSPGLMPDSVRKLINRTCDDLTDPQGTGDSWPGHDRFSGHGRVNILAARAAVPARFAHLETPAANQLVTGTLDIIGTATSDTPTDYTLEYGHGTLPTEWVPLAGGTAAVSTSLLGTWSTQGLDGLHTVRLRVGATHVAMRTVFVVNTDVAHIESPATGDTVVGWAPIVGTASAATFECYTLEWGEGTSPHSWHPLQQSTTPVVDGPLGSWYAGGMDDGWYAVRLILYGPDDTLAVDSCAVYLRSTFTGQQAWKLPLYSEAPALVANHGDFDRDGVNEIAVGTQQGVRFIRLDGTPKRTGVPEFSEHHSCQTPVAVGDLDGDGTEDLAVVDDSGYLWGFPSNEQRWVTRVPVPPATSTFNSVQDYRFAALVLKDLDGDNRDEVHYFPGWISQQHHPYYIFGADGALRLQFPSTALIQNRRFWDYHPADLDGDGKDELYLASDRLFVADPGGQLRDSFDLKLDLPVAPTTLNMSSVDLDGDRVHELILFAFVNAPGAEHLLYAFDEGLKLLPGWPHATGIDYLWAPTEPVFCDVDQDGALEYFISWFDTEFGRINAWHLDGTPLSGHHTYAVWATSSDPAKLRSPLVADLNSDGFPDLVTCATEDMFMTFPVERLIAWDHLGKLLPGWPIILESNAPLLGSGWRTTMAIGDLDRDGRTDLLTTTSENNLVFINLDNAAYDSTTEAVPFWRYNRSLNNTAPIPDRLEVIAVGPTALQPDVQAQSPVWVRFSHELDAASADPAQFRVTGSQSGTHAGALSLDPSGRELRFVPHEPFQTGERVEVTLGAGVRTPSGIELPGPWSTSFSVGARIPQVDSTRPVPDAVDIAPRTGIAVTFNTALDVGTLSDTTLIVQGDLAGEYSGVIAYDSASRTIHFAPDTTFMPAEKITVRVTPGLRSSRGIRMVESASWHFKIVPPQVTALVPAANAVGVPRHTSITASFDGPMPPSTIHDSALVVFGSVSGRHMGTIGYVPVTQTVRLTPDHPFSPGEAVTAIFPFAQRVWSFRVNVNATPAQFPQYRTHARRPQGARVGAADLDGDGDVDLCAARGEAGALEILRNAGGGDMSTTVLSVGGWIADMLPGDLDGDGDLDLATADPIAGRVHIYTNDGDASFSMGAAIDVSSIRGLLATDLDGDGHVDLGTRRADVAAVVLFLNQPGAGYVAAETLSTLLPPVDACAADLDRDGDMDLCCLDTAGALQVFANDGRGHFAAAETYGVRNRACALDLIDLDLDGDVDAAIAHRDGRLAIMRNTGTGTLVMDRLYVVAPTGSDVTAADIDADGFPDLITADGDQKTVSVLVNNGNGILAPPLHFATGDTAWQVIAADFNGDGKLDLASGGAHTFSVLFSASPASIDDDSDPLLPDRFALEQNFPNPFNASTAISFALPQAVHVKLDVFNLLGRRVITLTDAIWPAGFHDLIWDGCTESGRAVPSGLYFYRLETGHFTQTNKMVLLK